MNANAWEILIRRNRGHWENFCNFFFSSTFFFLIFFVRFRFLVWEFFFLFNVFGKIFLEEWKKIEFFFSIVCWSFIHAGLINNGMRCKLEPIGTAGYVYVMGKLVLIHSPLSCTFWYQDIDKHVKLCNAQALIIRQRT